MDRHVTDRHDRDDRVDDCQNMDRRITDHHDVDRHSVGSDMKELLIDLSNSSGFFDELSPHTNDELMSALDALEEHANDSIEASRHTELYWLQTLQERDDIILSKSQSITDLQRFNDRLKEENRLLKEQLANAADLDLLIELQQDADDSRQMSLQVCDESSLGSTLLSVPHTVWYIRAYKCIYVYIYIGTNEE